ncbi:MAG: alginate export family protein [Acidobacteriaceae bacterium]
MKKYGLAGPASLPFLLALFVASGSAQSHPLNRPVSISIYDRTRVEVWQWFAAPPESETYDYVESLLRVGVAQRIHRWDWKLELAQPAVLGLPDNAISPVSAQGQLGFGGTYYASNGNNTDPAAAFLKQAFLRYDFHGGDKNLRTGRFEFFEGMETQPKNDTIRWLQSNRVQQRLVGNFGFSNAQRSFDGIDGHYGAKTWDLTGMAGRADQGVFNMNGNPELNVDLQYLAFTRSQWNNRILWRAFGIGYHDGRTGVVKTDNRPLAVRQADHKNIRLGTYGADLLASLPAGKGNFDFLFWGALQNGNWGQLNHGAGAFAVEGGYQWNKAYSSPWLRAGTFRSTGDTNPLDNEHHTFFQILPTPRVYARFPFYNLMNNKDQFVQVIDHPAKHVAVRSDVHWLQLTSGKDLWYQGGGAFDNKVFGYVGRPGNGQSSFATVADLSADWQATQSIAVNFYYAHAWGKSVISAIYPSGKDAQFGYAELVYQWGVKQTAAAR